MKLRIRNWCSSTTAQGASASAEPMATRSGRRAMLQRRNAALQMQSAARYPGRGHHRDRGYGRGRPDRRRPEWGRVDRSGGGAERRAFVYSFQPRDEVEKAGEPAMFELQPHLTGDLLDLRPLAPEDWPALSRAASDPLIW